MSDNHTPEFTRKSTWHKVMAYKREFQGPTPVLLMDMDIVREKASLIGKGIRNSKVFYAVKANPDRELVKALDELGIGFEIASAGELNMLKELGVEPRRIITGNTVKTVNFIEELHSYGVRHFAFDSEEEVRKLGKYAPGSQVFIRLTVPNEGSEWPLSKKFGVELDDAFELMVLAGKCGLDPAGITFHVGSQCTNIYNWDSAIDKARRLWDMAMQAGLKPRMLNIGGGYPVPYTKHVADVATIEERIDRLIRDKFPLDTEIYIEPGRAVVGDAGFFLTSVIGKARRGDENWLYIDVGVFGGLMESVGGIKYTYVVENGSRAKAWVVAGPTCDSFDVMDRDVVLPEPGVGDTLVILASGAYTTSYASVFNGFDIPPTILL